ncbi:hypothetical protein ACWD6R_40220, partial [Streptomyces sp. NPDC005151]
PACPHLAHQPETTEAPSPDGASATTYGFGSETAAGKLTLSIIRDELARIVEQRAAEDPNLHYFDGRDLYGESDSAELPLPDELHPDAATHRRIGERFAELAFNTGGPFASTTPGTGGIPCECCDCGTN